MTNQQERGSCFLQMTDVLCFCLIGLTHKQKESNNAALSLVDRIISGC